jgi:short subunit fatty acids transporter
MRSNFLARIGGALADACERWFPDAFVFAIVVLLCWLFARTLAYIPPQ